MVRVKSFLVLISLATLIAFAVIGCGATVAAKNNEYDPLTSEQSERVLEALLLLKISPNTWTIRRIRSSHPVAASYKGFLLLSDGIFSRVGSVGELAFILAHEFAHNSLKHDLQDRLPLNIEKEADRSALLLLIKANICPSSSVTALGRMMDNSGSTSYSINDKNPPSTLRGTTPENLKLSEQDYQIVERVKALTPLISRLPPCTYSVSHKALPK